MTSRIFGRRRNFLINSPYQHRLSIITTLLALLPPAIFFGIYELITAEGSRLIVEANPSLAPLVRGQDRTESLLILAAVLFYGLGVYLVSLLESHKTAGFVYRIDVRLKELAQGHYGGAVRPRRDDSFTHLADSINELSATLRKRTEDDLGLLAEIGTSLESLLAGLGPSAAGAERLQALQGRIEAFANLKRRHLPHQPLPDAQLLPELIDGEPVSPAAAKVEQLQP
ncbi:MAG: hypothetical protein ACE5ID_07305 [Acidobacteriota bacterium]